MPEPGPGDRLLARLAGSRHVRHTLYAVFALTAAATLWFRVWGGRAEQALPAYGGVISLYGFGMAFASTGAMCRTGWIAFGLLVASAFTRGLLAEWTRALGLVEAACCLWLLAVLAGLSRNRGPAP